MRHPATTKSTDRVAIVTGGSRGIGREVARKLARRDYAVVVNCAASQADAETAVEHPPGWPPALMGRRGLPPEAVEAAKQLATCRICSPMSRAHAADGWAVG